MFAVSILADLYTKLHSQCIKGPLDTHDAAYSGAEKLDLTCSSAENKSERIEVLFKVHHSYQSGFVAYTAFNRRV